MRIVISPVSAGLVDLLLVFPSGLVRFLDEVEVGHVAEEAIGWSAMYGDCPIDSSAF